MGIFWTEFVLLFNTNPPLVTFIWTVSAFGLGAAIGHWLAKRRDRRKEFNAVADPLFLVLDAFRDDCLEGKRDMPKITRDDFRRLRPHLTTEQTRKYQANIDNFFEVLTANEVYEDGWIFPVIGEPLAIIPAIERLLVNLKHR